MRSPHRSTRNRPRSNATQTAVRESCPALLPLVDLSSLQHKHTLACSPSARARLAPRKCQVPPIIIANTRRSCIAVSSPLGLVGDGDGDGGRRSPERTALGAGVQFIEAMLRILSVCDNTSRFVRKPKPAKLALASRLCAKFVSASVCVFVRSRRNRLPPNYCTAFPYQGVGGGRMHVCARNSIHQQCRAWARHARANDLCDVRRDKCRDTTDASSSAHSHLSPQFK